MHHTRQQHVLPLLLMLLQLAAHAAAQQSNATNATAPPAPPQLRTGAAPAAAAAAAAAAPVPAAAAAPQKQQRVSRAAAALAAGSNAAGLRLQPVALPGLPAPQQQAANAADGLRARPTLRRSSSNSGRSAAAAPAAAASWSGRYIVQLKAAPAAAAIGPAIATAAGAPLKRNVTLDGFRSAAVKSLTASVAAAAGVGRKVTHTFTYALAGFAVANPSAAQLAALGADPNVASVTPDRILQLHTFSTPRFLGLKSPGRSKGSTKKRPPGSSAIGGVWGQLGGVLADSGAGDGVVIGILDTGIYLPSHACFQDANYWSSANTNYGQYYRQLADWAGVCLLGAGNAAPPCNLKVMGQRYYTASWGGDAALIERFPLEVLSAEDVDGHGSHTASTAGGNFGDTSPGFASTDLLSGMAPRARLAVYKVCWGGDEGGCAESDTVQAVDDAIQDGVDILSYSIGGEPSGFRSTTSAAFMHAARAGIFVSASAGNSGPDASTADNLSPWITTVAASTHDRAFRITLTLGDGTTFVGAGSQKTALGPLPLAYAKNLTAEGADAAAAALCAPSSLSAAAAGKIVVCDRGTYFIDEKVAELVRVGALGMVLVNVPGGSTNLFSQAFALPHVHLAGTDRPAVVAYASGASPTATLSAREIVYGITAPTMASFSSRGPVTFGNGVVLQPDITAPGVDVHAAYTGAAGNPLYGTLSGTSMACPHISGIAALLKARFPKWSPMAIKSAIMTTAYQTTRTGDVGQAFGNANNYGAGHVDPTAMLNPGLVFDSSFQDWQRFLCDADPWPYQSFCDTLCKGSKGQSAGEASAQDASAPTGAQAEPTDAVASHIRRPPFYQDPGTSCSAANLNMPAVASGGVVGSLAVRRTLTAVTTAAVASSSAVTATPSVTPFTSGKGQLQYAAVALADPGSSFDITVKPSSFKVSGVGSKQDVSITISRRGDTALNAYQFGQVVWTSNRGHRVRIPVAVSFADWFAPTALYPTTRSPAFTTGYAVTGAAGAVVSVASRGVAAATVTALPVQQMVDGNSNNSFTVTVPEGCTYVAVGIFTEDLPPGTDLDLAVLYDGEAVGSSFRVGSSTELLEAPTGLPAGEYQIFLFGTTVPGGTVTARAHVWMFGATGPPPSGAAQMQVTPSSLAFAGASGSRTVAVAFSGLSFTGKPPQRYIGIVDYARTDGLPLKPESTRLYFF